MLTNHSLIFVLLLYVLREYQEKHCVFVSRILDRFFDRRSRTFRICSSYYSLYHEFEFQLTIKLVEIYYDCVVVSSLVQRTSNTPGSALPSLLLFAARFRTILDQLLQE